MVSITPKKHTQGAVGYTYIYIYIYIYIDDVLSVAPCFLQDCLMFAMTCGNMIL